MIATTGSHTQACTLLVVADNADTQTVILEHARAQACVCDPVVAIMMAILPR